MPPSTDESGALSGRARETAQALDVVRYVLDQASAAPGGNAELVLPESAIAAALMAEPHAESVGERAAAIFNQHANSVAGYLARSGDGQPGGTP